MPRTWGGPQSARAGCGGLRREQLHPVCRLPVEETRSGGSEADLITMTSLTKTERTVRTGPDLSFP